MKPLERTEQRLLDSIACELLMHACPGWRIRIVGFDSGQLVVHQRTDYADPQHCWLRVFGFTPKHELASLVQRDLVRIERNPSRLDPVTRWYGDHIPLYCFQPTQDGWMAASAPIRGLEVALRLGQDVCVRASAGITHRFMHGRDRL